MVLFWALVEVVHGLVDPVEQPDERGEGQPLRRFLEHNQKPNVHAIHQGADDVEPIVNPDLDVEDSDGRAACFFVGEAEAYQQNQIQEEIPADLEKVVF